MEIPSQSNERIGYPTQKPEKLLERILLAASKAGDVVGDFFVGGGTTPVVAQRLGRKWITCDISRVAFALTEDRVVSLISGVQGSEHPKETQQTLGPVPDVSLEYWGFYEVPALTRLSNEDFRRFVIQAYDGRIATGGGMIHGYKEGLPLHVGVASQTAPITKREVLEFAEEIVTKRGKHEGTILAWAFAPSAQEAAQRLNSQEAVQVDFVRLQLIPIESDQFKEHVTSRHREYKNLLSFILPPVVRLRYKRLGPLLYDFDISESTTLNASSKIINVQWDFDYKDVFTSTAGYSFMRGKNNEPLLKTTYKFGSGGFRRVACRVQDDLGGEKMELEDMDVR
jgi:hypothetical protein